MSSHAQTATPAKTRKPLWKRWWVWVIAALLVIVAFATIADSGTDEAASSAPTIDISVPAEVPPPPVESAPPADDPLSDGGWTATDIQVESSEFGDSISARIINNEDSIRTGLFTLTVFENGQRVAALMGSASDVEPGATATVQFIASEQRYPNPEALTYELQADL